MKEFVPILKKSLLFDGVEEQEIASMLGCLNARQKNYKKGEYVLSQGESIDNVMVLVKGELLVQQDDYWGKRSIISRIAQGEMFGEAYLGPEKGAIINDVMASCDSTVIFFDANRVITTCSSACRFHNMVIRNLFFAISEKNRLLLQKLGHISKRSTREKLMSYLSQQAKQLGSSNFSIPFNRQQLADFLSVDRSAMSNELCKMRDEGLLEFDKNNFTLKEV